jgi:hypothetical protein
MKRAFVNRQLITQTVFDSGALTPLGTVVHKFTSPGEHLCTLYQEDRPVGHFRLVVNEGAVNVQLDVDLATLHPTGPKPCDPEPEKRFEVRPGGRVIFFTSAGRSGYAVVIQPTPGTAQDVVFDSRTLNGGDLFILTLLRPGSYRAVNMYSDAVCTINVLYPERSEHPQRSFEFEEVTLTEKGFSPTAIEVQSTHGVAFQLNAPARIRVELEEPVERRPAPEGALTTAQEMSRRRKVTWRKPTVKSLSSD